MSRLLFRFFVQFFLVTLASCQTAKVQEPVLADQVVAAAHGRFEVIELRSLDGTLIRAHLFKPKGSGPFPAVVALHGCAGLVSSRGQMSPRDLAWGERLAAEGYVALYPDSLRARGLQEICTSKAGLDFPKKRRPYDAAAALEWLAKSPDVIRDSIGIMGWSNGGSSLLWTIDEKFPARPQDDQPDFKVAIAFYPGCKSAARDPLWRNRIPLQIHMGENDNWTSPAPCRAIIDRMRALPPPRPKAEITLYPEAFHDFDAPGMPLQRRKGLAFVAGPDHEATLGTNERARTLAIERTLEELSRVLKKAKP